MKICQLFSFLLLTLGLSTPAFAQLSLGGNYFGTSVGVDYWFSVSGDGKTMSFVEISANLSILDSGSGAIDSDNAGAFTTADGTEVTYKVSGTTVSGKVAGLAYTATLEPFIGSQSEVSGVYTGLFQDYLRVNTDTFVGNLLVFPSGKVVLSVSNSGGGIFGIGTLDSSGQVDMPVVYSESGNVRSVAFSFSFSGGNNTLSGQVQASSSNGTYAGFGRSVDFHYLLALGRGAPLINISTRGLVAPSQLMIGGFVIRDRAKTVLIRAVGPRLGDFGVSSANADPKLELYSGQTVIASNDNWSDNANATEIVTASIQAGAFSLLAGSKDAVLLVKLLPGPYTVQASSVGGASGDALIEVYEITK